MEPLGSHAIVKLVGTEGLGEPSRGGIMGHQVAMVTAVRRSPPLNWGSEIHVKRLDKSWECWQTLVLSS